MKQKLIAFMLAILMAMPSNFTIAGAETVDKSGIIETTKKTESKDLLEKQEEYDLLSEDTEELELSEQNYVVSVESPKTYYFEDGKYQMDYVPIEKITLENSIPTEKISGITSQEENQIGKEKYSIEQYTVPFTSGKSSEYDFLNDCSTNYGFMQFDSYDNAYALELFYIRMLNILSERYQNYEDIKASDFDGKKLFCIGSVEYGSLGLTLEDVGKVFCSLWNDHPLFYFISNSFIYDGMNLYLMTMEEFVQGQIRKNFQEKIEHMIRDFESKTAELKSNYEIVKKVHDVIIAEVKYAYLEDGITPKDTPYVHNIIGYILDEKEVVCDGYSKTFAAVLNFLDIENIYVTGWGVAQGSETSSENAHAWNMVKLGNEKYYFVDCTWDDIEDQELQTKYLCIGSDFYKDHSILENGESIDEVAFLYPLPEVAKVNFFGEDDRLILEADPKYEALNHIIYEFNDGVLTFSGRGRVGNTYQMGEPAKEEPWSIYKENTEKIIFEEGINSISHFAFMGFRNVAQIVFPKEMSSLGQQVFDGCTSLEEVVLPNEIRYYGGGMFDNCSSLKKLTIGELKTGDSFAYSTSFLNNCKNLENIIVLEPHPVFKAKNGVLFEDKCLITYPGGKKDKTYTIPSEVVEICKGAFNNNDYIEEIIIPDTVKIISSYAFESCLSLTYLSFPESIQTFIGENEINWDGSSNVGEPAVYECENLKYIENKSEAKLYLKHKYNYSSTDYWINCENEKITDSISKGKVIKKSFENRLQRAQIIKIDNIVYKCIEAIQDEKEAVKQYNDGNTIGTLEILETVDGFTYSSVLEYKGWKYTVKPEGEKENYFEFENGVLTFKGSGIIGSLYNDSANGYNEKWLQYIDSTKKIVFDEGIEIIGSSAFSCFQNVKEIVFPEKLEIIGNGAFSNCYALEEAVLPGNIKFYGDGIFTNCINLKKIVIGKQANDIKVTYNSNWIGVQCRNLEEIIVPEDHTVFKVIDNVLFDKKDFDLIAYPGGKKDKIYKIPDGTNWIGNYAFQENEFIEKIIIPNSVTLIVSSAIRQCANLKCIENQSETPLQLYWDSSSWAVRYEGKMWKDSTTGKSVFSVKNGIVNAESFEVLYEGNEIIDENVTYRCLKDLSSFKDYQEIMEVYDSGKAIGTVEIVNADYDYEYSPVVNIGGLNYEVVPFDNEKPGYHEVNFDTQGGSDVKNQIVKDQGKIREPKIPIKDGYTFFGWYEGNKDSKHYYWFDNGICTETITEDITLYAEWISNITNIVLDKSEISLTLGDTIRLIATIEPEDVFNQQLIWSSSDESIASVSKEGVITALKEGNAIITVTTEDGNKKASCKVTVEKKESQKELGDVDHSGKVDSLDALIVLKITASLITPTERQERVADVNGDGKVDSLDALLILKYVAGLITEL